MSDNVFIPDDRTQKQPVHCFCRNPMCRVKSTDLWFVFSTEHEKVACPKCGADKVGMVGVLTLTHLLLPDVGGALQGVNGSRWKIACDQQRAYQATLTNNEATTNVPSVANCPGCLAVMETLKVRADSCKPLRFKQET